MKKINKFSISCLAFCSAALLPIITLKAQDTTRVRETTVIHDNTNNTNNNNENRELLMGEFGIHYLPTFTTLAMRNYNGDAVDATVAMSHGFGIMAGFNFSKYAGLQLEVNYDQIAQKYKDRGLDEKVSLNYINIPVLLTVNTDKTKPVFFGVHVGPQFGINIGSKASGDSGPDSDTLHAVVAVKTGDVGLVYGAGFGFALTPEHTIRLDLGFRGVYGLVDINGTPAGNDTYNVLVKGARKSYGGYLGITFLF
jgi:hypothetical protein